MFLLIGGGGGNYMYARTPHYMTRAAPRVPPIVYSFPPGAPPHMRGGPVYQRGRARPPFRSHSPNNTIIPPG